MTSLAQAASTAVDEFVDAHGATYLPLCHLITAAGDKLALITSHDQVSRCFATLSRQHQDRACRLNPGARRRG